MRQPSAPRPPTRPIGRSGATAVLAGAAMGVPVGLRVACHLSSWVTGPGGCVPGGAPAGALAGAVLAVVALPLLGQGTRRGEHAAHRPAPTTTTAARLIWLAVAAALGRWLAQAVLHPQMGLEGVLWLALLPVVLVAAAGLAMVAQGLGPPPIDLATAALFLAVSVAVLVLLMTPATSRDFRSSRQPPRPT